MWTVVLLLLHGCEAVPARSVSEVEFPTGFALDTHRDLAIRVDAAPGFDPSGVHLSIRSPGGLPLYEGPATHAIAHGVTVRVAANLDAVEVHSVDAARVERSARLDVDPSGRATFTVGGGW